MPAVTATTTIDAPVESVFEFVADPWQRRRLLPDNFENFRVVSDTTRGPGTRTSFTIATRDGEHESVVEVSDWQPPRGLTEQTRGGEGYTMRWTFEPEADGTRVTVVTEYPSAGSILHRLVDRFFAQAALRRSLKVELYRLKQLAEGGEE
jgi:uncharacterized protein YndB with AHSA1/START domain